MRVFYLLLVFCLLAASPLRATSILPLSLDQMTEQSGTIFVGRCQGQETALDEQGIPATYVRFDVEQGLKGVKDGGSLLIKQFGAAGAALSVPEGQSAVVAPKTLSLAGSSYRAGAEYLLFLYPESDLGFTSPVGGGQGRFEILNPGGSSGALAVNPLDNRFLKTFQQGAVSLSDLTQAVRKKVAP